MSKKLHITASTTYDDAFQTVPVNSGRALQFESDLGLVSVQIYIKDFDGSNKHTPGTEDGPETDNQSTPNFRLLITLKPSEAISGTQLLFGNECLTPVKDRVPVSLLSTGLKFFSWFINPSIKSDLYGDMPYLYGYALNSFSKINVRKDITNTDGQDSIVPSAGSTENLNEGLDNQDIPIKSEGRKKFFTNADNASKFTFLEGQTYTFQFDTDLIKLGNSQHKISIPTYGNRTLDIDVAQYANENLNNFNWVLKKDGMNGAKEGTIGLLINFALTVDDSNTE
ncbi:uncharacterized protein CXQ87_003983 [Candidozyma duobushaemuli]|uniref:Domain of unknown function at the cortex 1 domain-containing protein n=2 Tax=Candidozyma TaxID=3303203 RepID=A0ABX8IB56_9ASCO|nr:uncharacterized protein CXQ87_003983 [[Candida] duobushaemulonis]PVH16119.1 hypothetical protein CXQ87_003983 [[Candida] duobushaemulonis]QWU89202.1 hypothetical protein CA3LBN_003525 [[Candida] haemuloni]